ncbi:MAG TPA: hypothetical protein VJP58_02320 [Candidatus Nitrosocosmicus sp.]|nr:hypothetical protein [Candidatus Nitrosocosmicus sp.]
MRDSSHIGALTFETLKRLMHEAGLVKLKSKYHELEMRLESILKSSFPNPEDIPESNNYLKKIF